MSDALPPPPQGAATPPPPALNIPQFVPPEPPSRARRHPAAAVTVAAALVAGMAGDALLRVGPWGLNVSLWLVIVAALAVGLPLARRADLRAAGGLSWLLAACLFAALLTVRASPVLQVLNGGAAIGCLSMVAFAARSGRARVAGVAEWGWNVVLSVAHLGGGAGVLLIADTDWLQLSRGARSHRSGAVARGLLIALPLLILFGALFASADVFFSDLLAGSAPLSPGEAAGHIALVVVFAWLAAGYLWLVWIERRQPLQGANVGNWAGFGRIEAAVVFGLLDLLFLAFVAVQFRYLFGGAGSVEASSTLTYAEYARRGFFELVAVAALVVPVILLGHWALRGRGGRLYTTLAAALVLLVFVVIASALRRMNLYVDTYGLTQFRLYTVAFMGWVALVLAWLGLTVLRDHRDGFPFGAAVAALAVVLALNAVNPDGLIASQNLSAADERDFDESYAAGLSPDAMPALIAGLDRLAGPERCRLAAAIDQRKIGDGGWRTWNLSRWRAERARRHNRDSLRAVCS